MSDAGRGVKEGGKRMVHVNGPFGRLNTWLIVTAFLVLTLAAPSRASADSLVTFNVTGTFPSISVSFSPGSTITIDTATGLATSATSLVLSNGYSFTGAPNNLNGNQPTLYQWYYPSLGVSLFFQDSPSILAAAQAGPVFAEFLNFNTGTGAKSADTTFTSTTPTPEPSSLLLLGAGLLGLVAIGRSKFARPMASA